MFTLHVAQAVHLDRASARLAAAAAAADAARRRRSLAPWRRDDPKVALLRGIPAFAGFARWQLRRIAAVADEVAIPAGTEFIRQGAPGREVFILLHGAAAVRRDDELIARLGIGDVAGELAPMPS